MPAVGHCTAQGVVPARTHVAGIRKSRLGTLIVRAKTCDRTPARHCSVLQALGSALICEQAPAVCGSRFCWACGRSFCAAIASMVGRAASQPSGLCQLAPVSCSAEQFLEQLASGPIWSRQRYRRSLRFFFGRGCLSPKRLQLAGLCHVVVA